MNIRGQLTGSKLFLSRFSNTVWTFISPNNSIKFASNYRVGEDKIEKRDTYMSESSETDDMIKATFEEQKGWYAGIIADMFG